MFQINDHIITTDILYPIDAYTPGKVIDIIQYEVVCPILYTTQTLTEYLIDTGTFTTTVKPDDITIDKQYYRNLQIEQIIND